MGHVAAGSGRRRDILFTPKEARLVRRLDDPWKVQSWLNRLPYNWETHGATCRTFRGVVAHGRAHCLEAALSAATILEAHGYPPVLVDITSKDRLDHVLFVFQHKGRWGAIARSRAAGLHGRQPVFRSVAALVKSYHRPYIDRTGRATGYGVLDLRRLPTGRWRLDAGNVWHVEDALNANRHHRLPTHPLVYRRWKKRFDTWWEWHGRPDHEWPTDYPGKETWLWPDAKRH